MIESVFDPAVLDSVIGRMFDISKRISAWPILSALALCLLAFLGHYSVRRANFSKFLHYLFPRRIWRHPSALVDYQVAALTIASGPVRKTLFGLTVGAAAAGFLSLMTIYLGEPAHRMSAGFWSIVLLAAIIFLLSDFSTWLIHIVAHRWPFLWSFHRLHHSAEVLNPVTVARNHPVYQVSSKLTEMALVAPVQGAVAYFWPVEAATTVLFGVNIGYGLFALAGANLRHSHIWISFGPFERFVISPAQHQIHHSKAEEHWDKNMGEILAIWDWMAGTLVMTERKRAKLEFGLAGETQPHSSLLNAIMEPFGYARRVGWRRRSDSGRDI